MVVLRPQSEYGHAPPPQTPYSIVTNIPGWNVLERIREGDFSAMAGIVHIYPRFGPMHHVSRLSAEMAEKLGMDGSVAFPYLNPNMWPYTRRFVENEGREEHAIKRDELTLKCVDIAGHRLFVILFNPKHMHATFASWGNPGVGLSVRGAEQLMKGLDTMKEVPITDFDQLPTPSWTPESWAHDGLRHRIKDLVRRAPRDPAKVACESSDVFLYPTGMAAVWHATETLLRYRPGTSVIFGVVFHNTHHHLQEETKAVGGWKHFGQTNNEGIDKFEAWLDGEAREKRPVSFVYIEVPGNPTLATTNLGRMKALSEKHGFVLILDDTVAGFANVDIFPEADLLLTSLTKSFSGQSNVMGGSVVLNPLSPHYGDVSQHFGASFNNELFAADAEVLLSNSHDFLARSRRLNRNARAMAEFLHDRAISDPDSIVARVQYPSLLLPDRDLYESYRRRSTPEFPEPGYGCLLTVELVSTAAAMAFYNRLGFYPSPHLGGHVTLQFAYNMAVFGKKEEERAYMRECNVKEEGIRISAGYERVEDLIDTLKDALDKATEDLKTDAVTQDAKENGPANREQ